MNLPERKETMLRLMLIAAIAISLSACTSGRTSGRDSDTLSTELISEESADTTEFFLTSDSIGDIRVGMEIKDIPESIPGLYTHFRPQSGMDSQDFVFYRNEEPLFLAMDFGEGSIDVINVTTPYIGVIIRGEEAVHVGDSFINVIRNGASAEWIGMDGEGMWGWRVDGIWFLPDATGSLPSALLSKLYNPSAAPSKDDFTDSVKIGYIGTGLPF